MLIIRLESWPLLKTLAAFVYGTEECTLQEHTHIYNLMKDHIKVLNNNLKGKTFLVGSTLTIADLQLAIC
jgi:glutathione S-transferase